ncbi:MAG: Na+/H+ antiporter subunit B [Psychroflexus sp.]|jgi:multicomponent Na+:H+ antiporter subunit B|nr:Na+/H+ antiporter subunit B [Psychroflexus sp.]MDR9448409.1 Na+/H+ antiporter subunit B [Psychroflexus sp.]
MQTTILKAASNFLLPVLLLFSIFILLRGHYLPGGGFIGGLIASSAFVLDAFANGLMNTKSMLKFHPGFLMPLGLTFSSAAAIMPLFVGKNLMEALWMKGHVAVIGKLGTPLLFDTGVYIVVVGAVLTIIFTISESR